MRRALAAALAVPLLLTACGGGARTDENMAIPEAARGSTAAPDGSTAGPGGSTGAPDRGAAAPVLTCAGLDRPVSAGAPDARTDARTEGRALPNLTLDCLGGGAPVALRTLRGPLVLNVWASWCKPCRAELPFLTAARAELGERVLFAGIAVSDADAPAREWLAYHGVPWPSLADRSGSVRGPLRIPGPPVTLFVNSEGRIAGVHYGAFTSARAVRDAVAEHLQVS